MDVKEFMNSPMMWIMSSFMIINILIMAAVFMHQAFKAAEEMGMEKNRVYSRSPFIYDYRYRPLLCTSHRPHCFNGNYWRAYSMDAYERYRCCTN